MNKLEKERVYIYKYYTVVVQELLNEIHMSHKHSPATVAY